MVTPVPATDGEGRPARGRGTAHTPARIALVVHGRFEADPRVSRHARAALRAGYRVAALCVVSPDNERPRWGADSGGALVFESGVRATTLLGRLRRLVRAARDRWPRRHGGGAAPAGQAKQDPGARHDPACRAASPLRLGGNLLTLGLLLRNNAGVFRQFRGIGAALVHANDLNVLPAGYLLARAWGAPLLYDSHELWTQLDADWSPFLRRLFTWLERLLIRRASAVITVNGPIADELARLHRIGRPTVVMNCPEVPASPPELPSQAAASAPLRVIYQGMLNPNRGLVELLDAVAMVPDVELSIRGPGSLRPVLAGRIEERGLADRVFLLPPVPMRDLVDALRGFSVGVVPYLPVGKNNTLCSPNKLFEYMAAGLAVICSDLPVLRAVVEDAGCGLLVPPGDAAATARALRQLAEDPACLAELRARAWRAARGRYNAEHEEGKMLALYTDLLASRKAARRHRSGHSGRRSGLCRVFGMLRAQ